MADVITINTTLTPAQQTDINTATATIVTALAGMNITLTHAEQAALIRVAVTRVAEIQDVNDNLFKKFLASIPVGFDGAAYTQDQKDLLTINGLLSSLEAMMNIILQGKTVLENNLMSRTLDIMETAKVQGKKDALLAKAYTKIANTYFDRKTKKTPTDFNLLAAVSMTVGNVVSKKNFVNQGTTILTFNKVGGPLSGLITVQPKGSILVPSRWTNIDVENLSATDPGKFSVYIK